MSNSDELKTPKDVMPSVLKNLSRQSAGQTRSADSRRFVALTYECHSCGKTWTAQSDKHDRAYKFLAECASCHRIRRDEYFSKLCPPLYQDTDINRLPAAQLKQALDWIYGPKGLILMGDTGSGKTRTAWTVLNRLLVSEKKDLSFEWFDAIGFGHAISKHYRDEDAETWLEQISKRDLIFFDDLGKLKLTERAETELFGLIERRCAAQLPIIATTNDTGDTLAARMTDNRGPAMIRRLREFCEIINFPSKP